MMTTSKQFLTQKRKFLPKRNIEKEIAMKKDKKNGKKKQT